MNSVTDDGTLLPPGCPIRVPSDRCLLGGSPRSFAACYALHRLLVPRHPPCALSSLTTFFFTKECNLHPATLGRFVRQFAAIPLFGCQRAVHLQTRLVSMRNLRPRVKGNIAVSLHTKPQPIAQQPLPSSPHLLAAKPISAKRCAGNRNRRMVEVTGFGPVASWLQTRCSPTELHPHREHLASIGAGRRRDAFGNGGPR